MKILSMHQVQFKYGNETILEDISLDINSNEFVTLTGPNGAAKSTLLRIMLGLLKPWRGTVNINKKMNKDRDLSLVTSLNKFLPLI